MTVRAQETQTAESVFKQIVINDEEDLAIRFSALARISDQEVIKQIALDSKQDAALRQSALARLR